MLELHQRREKELLLELQKKQEPNPKQKGQDTRRSKSLHESLKEVWLLHKMQHNFSRVEISCFIPKWERLLLEQTVCSSLQWGVSTQPV